MGLKALCSLALTGAMTVSPGKPKPSDVRLTAKDAPNVSKLIRSDTGAFAAYLARPSVENLLAPYTKLDSTSLEGVIQLDPHAGNVAPTPVRTKDGKFEIQVLTNDFDNVGEGYFVWEFVHNIVQAKAIEPDVKIKELLAAYLDGIDGKRMAPPTRVREALQTTEAEYNVLRDQYVAKKTRDGRFIRKAGNVVDYQGVYTATDMQALFPEGKVLDVAQHVREEGGNTGERIWILLELPSGVRLIKELKAYEETVIAMIRKQLPLIEWSHQFHEVMWPGIDPSSYDVVTMKDGRIFWRRDRVISLLDVPRSSEQKDEARFRKELVLFDANFFGLSVGSQKNGALFAKLIRTDEERFRDVVKAVAKPYLKAAERVVDK